jgi:hypothetical protein
VVVVVVVVMAMSVITCIRLRALRGDRSVLHFATLVPLPTSLQSGQGAQPWLCIEPARVEVSRLTT